MEFWLEFLLLKVIHSLFSHHLNQKFVEILSRFGCEVEWQMVEGGWVDVEEGGKVEVGVVRGPARKILMGERMVLNLISRCSGVASKTRNAVTIASKVPQFSGRIAGTRKTTPGFRLVEKYGLLVGGASSHRFDLSQSLMIKDNHIDASGGIRLVLIYFTTLIYWFGLCDREAIRRGKEVVPHTIKIEVECRSLEDAMEACEEGVDIVMLDNFPPDLCLQSALTIKEEYPHVVVEVSGGIDEENVGDYLGEGVDIVMTHSYQPVDFSMKIKKLTP